MATPLAIRLVSGNYYLTSEGGGGRTTDPNTDPLHTNRRVTQGIDIWEHFEIRSVSPNHHKIGTSDGTHWLTAVDGGGRATDAVHTDATSVGAWETFKLEFQGDGTYAIQTADGHYLSAVGNRSQNAVRTDATSIGTAERFWLILVVPV